VRITQSMMLQESIREIRLNSELRNRAQLEAGTGLRIANASDDPAGADRVMAIASRLADADRYHRASVNAQTLLNAQDSAITSARDLIAKATDLARSVADAPAGDPLRATVASQIQQLEQQVLALGNTQVGDRYVFAGSGPGGAPAFTPAGVYGGDLKPITVEVGPGVQVDATTAGQPVFSDALTALQALGNQVQSGTGTGINNAIQTTAAAASQMLDTQTDIGARLARVSSADSQGATTISQLKTERDALLMVDPAEAGVKLTAAQAAVERAYAVVAKVLSTDLLSYLK